MEKKRSFFNLEETFRQAVEKLAALEPAAVAEKAGVEFQNEKNSFILPFLKQTCRVNHTTGKIYYHDGSPVSQYLAIIMLHYLITADGTPLTGRWVSFRHLPGGDIYMPPFKGRAIMPFLKTFGHYPDDFLKQALAAGGYRARSRGASVMIPVMPRVPLMFTIWPGDDEFLPSGNILFDEAAPSYLPTEDYAHLPAVIIKEISS